MNIVSGLNAIIFFIVNLLTGQRNKNLEKKAIKFIFVGTSDLFRVFLLLRALSLFLSISRPSLSVPLHVGMSDAEIRFNIYYLKWSLMRHVGVIRNVNVTHSVDTLYGTLFIITVYLLRMAFHAFHIIVVSATQHYKMFF